MWKGAKQAITMLDTKSLHDGPFKHVAESFTRRLLNNCAICFLLK